jgi:phasin family protein
MTLAKAAMAESFSYTQDLLGAKSPQELMALQASLAQPLAEKSMLYSRHVSAVASDIGSEYKKAVDIRMAEAQTTFSNLIGSLTKSAPAGTEPGVVLFKTAMDASQNFMDATRVASDKAAELLQANVTALVKKVGDVSGASAAHAH